MTTPVPPWMPALPDPSVKMLYCVQLMGSTQRGGLDCGDEVLVTSNAREGGVDSAIGQASLPRAHGKVVEGRVGAVADGG